LTVWAPIAREPRWRIELADSWIGGTLATAGKLVFEGTNRGQANACRADDGAKVWSPDGQSGIHAARGVQP